MTLWEFLDMAVAAMSEFWWITVPVVLLIAAWGAPGVSTSVRSMFTRH